MAESSKRIQVGVITAAHGVRGQVKLKSFTQNPKDLLSFTPLTDASGNRSFKLASQGVQGQDTLIVTVEGIADRNAAELLKNTPLFAPAEQLPEAEDGAWYYGELVDMQARTEDGKAYGMVTAVNNYGAGDIIEIKRVDGTLEMLPFSPAFVGDVVVQERYLVVFPPDYIEGDEP